MALLRIPDRDEEDTLASLATMPEGEFEAILEAMSATPARAITRLYSEEVRNKVSAVDGEVLRDLMSSVLGIAGAAHIKQLDATSVAEDLVGQLLKNGRLESDESTGLKDRLTRIFSVKSLRLTSQSFPYPISSTFSSSGIDTFLKPFTADRTVSENIDGASIMHQLRIAIAGVGDSDEVVTCTVDEEDLRQLQTQVERALTERQNLKEFLRKAGLAFISDEL